ncbi:hypothetical protein OG948_00485 [Embleya sp. NBC_00888]|uniref:hypothetical protein n=1 Tax=Embleya sp. NBC_00888 TaxID=2975960 RepID=UPI00386D9C2A|nr:hypothetical protein OG948_00485 [Embleya sp. NBC_00888]
MMVTSSSGTSSALRGPVSSPPYNNPGHEGAPAEHNGGATSAAPTTPVKTVGTTGGNGGSGTGADPGLIARYGTKKLTAGKPKGSGGNWLTSGLKIVYEYSGAKSVVECGMDPGVNGTCLEAGITVGGLLLTGGTGAAAKASLEGASKAAAARIASKDAVTGALATADDAAMLAERNAKKLDGGWKELYGPFKRIESKTQTDADAALMQDSGQLWGQGKPGGFFGSEARAEVWPGALKPGERGVEMYTPIKPRGTGPWGPTWPIGSPGTIKAVENGLDTVKVPVIITKNTQIPASSFSGQQPFFSPFMY